MEEGIEGKPITEKPRVRGNEIRFYVNPNDISNDEQIEELMKRLARLICSSDKYTFKKNDGYPWQLDESNEWWAGIGLGGDASNEVVVASRNGFAYQTEMSKLRDTIIYRLGLGLFNK